MQDLIEGSRVQEAELEDALARYEEAFHNFVDSHDNHLLFEDDVEKRDLMIDSYENQRDLKLQLDILVRKWRVKRQRASPPSESCFSLRSGKSGKSNVSSRNSVQERMKVVEEAKLQMRALQERQELQRELEEVEKGKAELSRKLELLDVRTKVKQAEIDLLLEQNVEDGMNEYLKEHYSKNPVCNESLSPASVNGTTPTSKPQPIISGKGITSLAEPSFAQSQLAVSSNQKQNQ